MIALSVLAAAAHGPVAARADSLRPIAVRVATDAATEGLFTIGPIRTGTRSCHRLRRHRATLIYGCRAWVSMWEGDTDTGLGNFERCAVLVHVYFVRDRLDGYWQKRGDCIVVSKASASPDKSRRARACPGAKRDNRLR